MASSLFSLFLLSISLSSVLALTCYVNDEQGHTYERTSEQWRYCSMIPFAAEGGKGRLAGVGADTESLVGFDATFGQNSKLYGVLAMCILEKYDFGAINPAFGANPEFMFRCFCGTDKCNHAATFGAFLSSQQRT